MVLRILNIEGHQNCKIGSKVKTVSTMFFIQINLDFFWILNQCIVDYVGVSKGWSVAVGVSDR